MAAPVAATGGDDETLGPLGPLGPLAHLRVVDLTDLRGALCARILGDLGADVLKIVDPAIGAAEIESVAYRYRNANKRGRRLDLTVDSERTAFHELLAEADVLIENLGPTARAMLGLAPDAVAERHPRLVHVALTDLGLDGPDAAWHLEPLPALAASGALWATGFPDRPPCSIPGYLAHDCASVHGALGAVAAIADRDRHTGAGPGLGLGPGLGPDLGLGQLVEVSAQEAALAGTIPWSILVPDYLHINPMLPAEGRRNADGFYIVLPVADGWVRVINGSNRQWDGFVELLGKPAALTGPEWQQPGYRGPNSDVVRIVAHEALAERTRAELFDQARQTGATIGVLHSLSEFVAHEQTRSRGFFAATGFPGLGDAPFATSAIRLSATPTSLRHPAPGLADEHAASFGPRSAPRGGLERLAMGHNEPGSDNGLLLDGVTVVEFGVAAVVPELCWMLSELGADVVKIESAVHPDVLRQTGGARFNCGFAFNAECRGRRSVALDLSTPEGRALAFSLCAKADVVAENHRGGVLEKLGLGYEALRTVNPSIVYASSQGYGRGGPFGEMPAYGPLNSGFAGVHLLWNHPDAPYPCGTSMNHPDHIAGKLLAVAVLAALEHRRRTGEGQLVEMAQTEAAAYLVGELYLEGALGGTDPQPVGNRSAVAVPHGVFPAAGDDAWVAIAVPDDGAWTRLCGALGWAADAAVATLAGRLAAVDAIESRLSAWTAVRAARECAELLQAHGVSAMPVLGPLEHRADPHLQARGYLVETEHAEVGLEHHVGQPTRWSRLATRTASSAPCLGAHTAEVLREHLGLTDDEIVALTERAVLR